MMEEGDLLDRVLGFVTSYRFVAWTTDRASESCDDWNPYDGDAMSESDNLRKLALECLRLGADCTQLARDIRNPTLQAYFIRMAGVWTAEGERRLCADP